MNPKLKIRAESVLIIEDHPLYIDQVVSILKIWNKSIVVDWVYTSEEGLQQLKKIEYDFILLDINLPCKNGLDFLTELHYYNRSIPVIILSQYNNSELDWICKKFGAVAFINKSVNSKQFISRLKLILDGQPEENSKRMTSGSNRFNILKKRELEILTLVCRQLNSSQIATKLSISLHTVKNHRKSINRKTGVSNVAGLMHWAIRNNIITNFMSTNSEIWKSKETENRIEL